MKYILAIILACNVQAQALEGHGGCYTQHVEFCSDTPIWCDSHVEPYYEYADGTIGDGNQAKYGKSLGTLCDRYSSHIARINKLGDLYLKEFIKNKKLGWKIRRLKRRLK